MIRNWFIFIVALLQFVGAAQYFLQGQTAVGVSFIGVGIANIALSTIGSP